MVRVETFIRTVIWHDQRSETVRQRLNDGDEARGMIQKDGSWSRLLNIKRSSQYTF